MTDSQAITQATTQTRTPWEAITIAMAEANWNIKQNGCITIRNKIWWFYLFREYEIPSALNISLVCLSGSHRGKRAGL